MENPCSAGTRIENYPARKAAALPALTQGLYALFFWYGMRYAYKHKTYNYRSFSNSLYGRTRPLMSNLYEICYLIMIGTASAAAFATGGSTIQTLSGLPTISQANGSFGSALWMAVLYFFFQLASVSVMYQHMEPVTDVKQINRAAIGMFVCNFAAMELSIIGLLAIAYAADAKVVHSHNYGCLAQLHRNFDLGVSQAQHPEIFDAYPSESEGIRMVKKSASYVCEIHKPWLLVTLFFQSGFKYVGYFLGKRYKSLPDSVIRWCTSNKTWWEYHGKIRKKRNRR